jgi:hypothetical protein
MTAKINTNIPTIEVREPFLRTDNELGEGEAMITLLVPVSRIHYARRSSV